MRARSPQARIAIVGHPWILPATGGCLDRMPVAEGGIPYLRSPPVALDDAVRRAAQRTGVTYVDLSTVSEGRDACQELGVRWGEPVLQGTHAVIVHPDALREAAMAAQTMGSSGCADTGRRPPWHPRTGATAPHPTRGEGHADSQPVPLGCRIAMAPDGGGN